MEDNQKQKNKRWTKEEIEYLKKNCNKLSLSELSKKLNRSESSVTSKIKRLNIAFSSAKTWTKEELDYVQDNWGKITYDKMARKLGRTETAIKVKSGRMHLGKRIHSSKDITFHKLLCALGLRQTYSHYNSQLIKYDFPFKYKETENTVYKMVNIAEFWIWCENNKNILSFHNFKKNILGPEPEWVDIKRKADANTPSRKHRNKPWTSYEDSLLISKVKSNRYTYTQLSQDFNRTESAIKRRLRDLKVPYRPIGRDNHIKWTKEETQQMIKMHEQGIHSYIIAKQLNKSQLTICEHIKAYYDGISEKNTNNAARKKVVGKWTEEEVEYLKSYWNIKTTKQIGEELGRSYYSVIRKATNIGLGENKAMKRINN